MAWAVQAKFRALVAPVLPADRADQLIALCWDAERLSNVGEIARAAAT